MQKLDSVVIRGEKKYYETGDRPDYVKNERSSSTLVGRKSEDLSNLAMDLISKQEDHKDYAKENRILKKQIHSLLAAQAQEVTNMEAELECLRKQNEDLERKIAQTEPSSRRLSHPSRADLDEIEARDSVIKRLSIKVDKACRIDKFMENHQRCNWAQGPSDSDGGMIKIKKAVVRLANSLKKCLLSPQEFGALIANDEKCHDTLEILTRTIDDVGFLFIEPWLVFRSFLFLFIRDRVFYSDIWAVFHCDGFVAREYQRVIELCGEI
ncbi:hypothetical protein N7533_011386 [Penicillium manginii]|uniref:uncharacterized protein n=1 Tax=Penicillium manginii TaxID=203109 RepID=UPI002547578A|nr:uncharacterized protein N7533_011386 [Penicillium manginii]KAJ5741977.1 hypothetical protein N7533_011386 [Penicillium manginii]